MHNNKCMSGNSFLVIGSNSGSISKTRYPSCFLLTMNQNLILLDCGEGSQFRLRDMKVKFMKLDLILISHIHGDHVLGLPGLLHTLSMQGRQKALTIICPKALKQILDLNFSSTNNHPSFEIDYIYTDEIDSDEKSFLFRNKHVTIKGIKLYHRIHTVGFLIEEAKKPYNININAIKEKGLVLEKSDFDSLQRGENIVHNGNVLSADTLTIKNTASIRFAYLTDTTFNIEIAKHINGFDAIYHEATYMEEHREIATKNGHSTAKEAACIAKAAKVQRLFIGHYSSRYDEVDILENEAKEIFENSTAVVEGNNYEL